MKALVKVVLVVACLTATILLPDLSAEPPSPPAGNHGGENNQPPSEAPIDGGVGILFVLGAAYAGIKAYKNRSGRKKCTRFFR